MSRAAYVKLLEMVEASDGVLHFESKKDLAAQLDTSGGAVSSALYRGEKDMEWITDLNDPGRPGYAFKVMRVKAPEGVVARRMMAAYLDAREEFRDYKQQLRHRTEDNYNSMRSAMGEYGRVIESCRKDVTNLMERVIQLEKQGMPKAPNVAVVQEAYNALSRLTPELAKILQLIQRHR